MDKGEAPLNGPHSCWYIRQFLNIFASGGAQFENVGAGIWTRHFYRLGQHCLGRQEKNKTQSSSDLEFQRKLEEYHISAEKNEIGRHPQKHCTHVPAGDPGKNSTKTPEIGLSLATFV